MLSTKHLRLFFLAVLTATACSISGSAWAQVRPNQLYVAYINQYKDLAIEQMLRYHIPASITLAQGLFESAAGRSRLATRGNNHFGIKCHGWTGRTISADDDAPGECFRAYDDARQSYEDHSRFLSDNPRYARLFRLRHDDYRGWAYGLKECGYATNPRYAQSLIGIIEAYNLHQYDKAKKFDHFMAEHAGEEAQATSVGGLHPIKRFNNNYYIIAREGDTFRSIGKETELSWRRLAKYNERDKHDVLHEGEIVYLKKKQRHAPKSFKKHPHTVQAGESLYDIAQRYGIRLKSLYKMNKFDPAHTIKVGDKIRVY